ncbi:hypothetical protein PILCRDRAFT_90210 [Piloderma croceum F 1598]|uniref:Uncharacterized protein n=1 Tax=Piloderma croceum (strain F 1598) TaxID=765440 RepID=A0A0C3F3J0_PILCF|nr:hypothetical protein PILCRDRAFT_90210 [Piloderma croceum F 1598]
MNDTYNYSKAAKKLGDMMAEQVKGDDGSYQLSQFVNNNHLQQNARVVKYEYPTTWRLIYKGGGTENAEVVLRFQGAITQKDLPPITNKPKDAHRSIYMQQSDGILEHWQPSTFTEHLVIDTSNRYLTSCCQNPSTKSLAFHHLVDPNGILADIAIGDLIHTKENDVKHFEWYPNKEEGQEK